MRPYLGWLPLARVNDTLNATTQYYKTTKWGHRMKRHYNSRFPRANLRSSNETVATDTKWWKGEPAADDGIIYHGGANGVQVFVGVTSKYMDIYPIKTDGEYNRTLLDHLRKCGVPNKVYSDRAKAEISADAIDTMRRYCITDAQSEPHYQNQNPAERHIQDLQAMTISIMNITGTPDKYWLLCIMYTANLLNHSARRSLDKRTPMEKKFGSTPDISKFLQF